jgi:exodeoxyribonuclease V alpha subunit
MTVHKSQGSEFRHVALVLPECSSPLLSRELLYTAVTRARERVSVFGGAESVVQGARRRVERGSGLRDLLKG